MAKRGVQIFCELCGFAYVVQLPGEVPLTCDGCKSATTWRTADDPRVAWDVTHNDKQFLRSLRIDAEN